MAEALQRVGYFRELHGGMSLPSIREAVRSSAHPDAGRIIAYLESGICLAACGGVQRDVLDPLSRQVTSPDIVTDGVWLWPGELAYYVGTYRVELPEAFVAHMRRNGWTVPVLGEAKMRALCDHFIGVPGSRVSCSSPCPSPSGCQRVASESALNRRKAPTAASEEPASSTIFDLDMVRAPPG